MHPCCENKGADHLCVFVFAFAKNWFLTTRILWYKVSGIPGIATLLNTYSLSFIWEFTAYSDMESTLAFVLVFK